MKTNTQKTQSTYRSSSWAYGATQGDDKSPLDPPLVRGAVQFLPPLVRGAGGIFGRSSRGFTLIESMISVAITSMIVAGVIAVFIAVQATMMKTAELNRVNTEARAFSDRLTRDLRMGAGLVPATDVLPDSTGAMIIKLPPIDEDEYAILNTTEFDLVAYYEDEQPDGTVIIRQVMPCDISSRRAESMVFGNAVRGNAVEGTFSAKPDALGAFVVHFRFKDSRVLRGKTYESFVSGSIRQRNKEQSVSP